VLESYTREQRTTLEQALKGGSSELQCPVCGAPMTRQDVVAPDNVPYVRHRVWLMCSACKRSVSLDAR